MLASGRIAWVGACAMASLALVACAPGPTPMAPPGVSVMHRYPGTPCLEGTPAYEDLGGFLEPFRTKYGLPALGAAVVTPQGVESLGVVGFRREGDPTPACREDTFHLGSDTKAMTATVIAKLVEEGKLSWKTTIHDVFPDVPQDPEWSDVTLEQLLAHRGGFAHDPSYDIRRFHGPMRQQREGYVRAALRDRPEKRPGTTESYSNTGYVVAGVMAERASGKLWEDLVREIVFRPLGMERVGFGWMAKPGTVDNLWAHRMDVSPTPIEPGPDSDNALVMGPAGTVHASLEDWAKFVADMLRSFDGKGQLLGQPLYDHLHQAPFGGDYAHGWVIANRDWAGGRAYTHAGSNTMNMAIAWVAPKRQFAILVASNVGSDKVSDACDDVVFKLIKRRAAQHPEVVVMGDGLEGGEWLVSDGALAMLTPEEDPSEPR
jgi:CubicO group peptidase (beta-lactamase class C family)